MAVSTEVTIVLLSLRVYVRKYEGTFVLSKVLSYFRTKVRKYESTSVPLRVQYALLLSEIDTFVRKYFRTKVRKYFRK